MSEAHSREHSAREAAAKRARSEAVTEARRARDDGMNQNAVRARAIWAALSTASSAGRQPTYRALMAAAGTRSSGDAQAAVRRLIRLGYVRRGPRGSCRTVTVLVPLITLPDRQQALAAGAENNGPAE